MKLGNKIRSLEKLKNYSICLYMNDTETSFSDITSVITHLRTQNESMSFESLVSLCYSIYKKNKTLKLGYNIICNLGYNLICRHDFIFSNAGFFFLLFFVAQIIDVETIDNMSQVHYSVLCPQVSSGHQTFFLVKTQKWISFSYINIQESHKIYLVDLNL